MSTILILTFSLSIPLSILITWIYIHKKIKIQAQTYGCPFKHACLHYDELETKEAAKRIAQLLLENLESETAYKQAIRVFIENNHHNEKEIKIEENTKIT